MNEKLTDKMIEWVGKTAEQIGDFAAKEIPPFIHEYLTWKFYEAAFDVAVYGLIILLLCVFWIFIVKRLVVWSDKWAYRSDGFSWLMTVVPVFFSLLTPFVMFPKSQIKDMIQINIAPKVYLLEKATEIIKK